jgi:hypothetical protein
VAEDSDSIFVGNFIRLGFTATGARPMSPDFGRHGFGGPSYCFHQHPMDRRPESEEEFS